jgi:hypothetical protein
MQELSQKLLTILREQIGAHGKYNGQDFELIEILEQEPAVVLQDCGAKHAIQNDMHGEAHRIVSTTHTIPLFSEVAVALHPVLADFLPKDISAQINSLIANHQFNRGDA